MKKLALLIALAACANAHAAQRNIIFILTDDHRHDFMGFHPGAPKFLETRAMDRMAAEGAHVRNAFVTTSLCSPSRASILTGQYAYRHEVVDNDRMIKKGAVFFPELLKKDGYRTAFVGKWHMGAHTDAPQRGFDRWVSFPGQGVYFDPVLNIDGERRAVKGYITDLLTDHALEWIKAQDGKRPFLLYLSHKAVHAGFEPAPRHRGRYAKAELQLPVSYQATERNYRDKPKWTWEQRHSTHGVDFIYGGETKLEQIYRSYAETLLALDEGIGRILDHLNKSGLAKNTIVLYMGDNGFSLGEHGLIDKRHAYEESIRVPMLAWAPGFISPRTTVEPMVLNVDVAPTLLEAAGLPVPAGMDGRSFLAQLRGQQVNGWRDAFVYTYYWESYYPHTPTVFALRENRYKFMYYHGVWDRNELYDLQNDPGERVNLIEVPDHRARAEAMHKRLFDALEAAGAVDVKFQRPVQGQADDRLLRPHH